MSATSSRDSWRILDLRVRVIRGGEDLLRERSENFFFLGGGERPVLGGETPPPPKRASSTEYSYKNSTQVTFFCEHSPQNANDGKVNNLTMFWVLKNITSGMFI